MKNFNFEWVVPVIVFMVFVIGNIMRILNWKNEQEKKAAKRPREFQIPRRPSAVQPKRRLRSPPNGGGRVSSDSPAADEPAPTTEPPRKPTAAAARAAATRRAA